MDLIALAHGSSVDVFSLQGEAASPSVQRQATLPHSAPVWKVQFNQMGTCLAAATEDNQVTVWRPNFVGEWISMCVLAGSEEMAEEGGAA
jgi:WD40 repeat protein